MQKNIITNLKNIWNKIISTCGLKKVFDNATGIYFDGATIFAVHLIKSENATAEQWQLIDTVEVTLFGTPKRTLSEKTKQILMEFDALEEDDEPDQSESQNYADVSALDSENKSDEIKNLLAEKVANICLTHNWRTDTMALCLKTSDVVFDLDDLSNIPDDKIENTVQYQVSVIGDFDIDSYLASFTKVDDKIWMEGISKIEAEKWSTTWQQNKMTLLALTAMPDEINHVDDIELSNIKSDFMNRGGFNALFAAKSLAHRIRPNFFLDRTADLTDWKYKRIAAIIAVSTLIFWLSVGFVDWWQLKTVQSELETEKAQAATLEKDKRKKKFIENIESELDDRNKILSALSKESFSWRSVLIHLGTVKVYGVWLTNVKTMENNVIEISGEAMTYEAMANFVNTLENDREFFHNVMVKSSNMHQEKNIVQFIIHLSL
ncbi:MAG: PilN domain-containing protein [Selenomonadaceae bacterium]|nr:PilN domain-containing protein [Selenomonadaceae bacterium]MBR1860044.1 PilN domain-containing protein [Selenomonadaceae bacterium]